jgi:TRAP-type C4-dicarboxylate transport system permease small subunit
LVVLMSAMVVDVTWQVASRYLLQAPSSFTEELAGFLLIWIGLLGAAYGFRTRAHLGIDLLVSRLGGGWRRGAEVLSHLLVLLFALITLVGGGIELVQLAFRLEQISAAMGVRMGFVYLALPLSGGLVMLFSAEAMWRAAREKG